ncbi:MAG TPA: hypothetical protein DEB39_13030 [Planctomycetaceae bacterium]|nr:hypothetical protein [Planctomycetaceae bacterium]
MPLIEGFWVRNYRVLKQISLGSSFQHTTVIQDDTGLPPYELRPFTVIAGGNGAGKSTVLDVFSFLADCLNEGVESAFRKRNGFHSVISQGCDEDDPISIGIVFRACADPRPLTYVVSFEAPSGRALRVANEAILYRSNESNPTNTMLLFFQNGLKTTRHVAPWPGMRRDDLEKVKATDSRRLALPFLGEFEDFPDVCPLFQNMSRWGNQSMSLDLSAALAPPLIPRLNNEQRINRLLELIKSMEEKHRFDFPGILNEISQKLPGVDQILIERTESGRCVLRFKMEAFERPLEAHEIGRGMLLFFAHMLQLEDSIPTPLFGFDDVEEGFDHAFCRLLAERLYNHVDMIGSTQFFVTAHAPRFLDCVDPRDVWILETGLDGFTSAFRASDDLANYDPSQFTASTRWFTDYVGRSGPVGG